MKQKTFIIIAMVLVFAFIADVNSQTDVASQKLSYAETAINQAFLAVYDAEQSGANVSSLITQLNDAQLLLADSKNAYRAGDENSALDNVELIVQASYEVKANAQLAKQTAISSAESAFTTNMILSIAGIFVLFAGLFIVWRFIKGRYLSDMCNSKPEVISNEAP